MWDAVRWTLATQLTALFDVSDDGAALLDPRDTPEHYFGLLRDAGALDDALRLMAFALPRRSCITWGHECVSRTAGAGKLKPADTVAHSAVGAWLNDPTDERRWVAHDTAQAAEFRTPEALLGFAVYVSGGSLSPPQSNIQVPAPADMSARLVSGAVLLASVRTEPMGIGRVKEDFLDRGLPFATGEKV